MIKAAKKFAITHLEPRFYGALWFVAVALLIAIIVLSIDDAEKHKDGITIIGAMFAIDIATVGWIWSGRMAILMARKTNALALMARISSSEVNIIKEKVYPYIEAYEAFKRSDDCTTRPEMPQEAIQTLLGVYEQVAVAVIYGAVDHDMIRNSQSMVFKRIYRGLAHHIERIQEKDPGYFENFENLTCTWHPSLQKRAAALTDPGGLFAPMRGADS